MRGGSGLAGEFGHLAVGGRGRGLPGTLEAYIGVEALLARYATHAKREGATLPDVMAALERGEAAALRTADDGGRWLVRGLVQIINTLDPSLIIVGGPVGAVPRFVGERVAEGLASRLPSGFPAPRIALSRFGLEGPADGAALLLHPRAFSVDERALHPDSRARNLFAS